MNVLLVSPIVFPCATSYPRFTGDYVKQSFYKSGRSSRDNAFCRVGKPSGRGGGERIRVVAASILRKPCRLCSPRDVVTHVLTCAMTFVNS